MRRFRLRRRRAAALALLPIAALFTATALAEAPANESARIDASSRSVAIGHAVKLRGSFPDARKAPIEIRHRRQGSARWRTVARDRTGAGGGYGVRVKPRASGFWRAELAPEDEGVAASTPPAADRGTGRERIAVRSRTRARLRGRHGLAGEKVRVSGKVSPAGAKRKVVVRIGKAKQVTRAGRRGRFEVGWRTPDTGVYEVRARARANRLAGASRDSAGEVVAYRSALASWYGPGLYGNSLACGGTLTPSTIGVAHKALPCGTKLRLRHRGRTVTARVVDRGPYSGSREFDLTAATKEKLRFPDVGRILTSR